MEHDIDALDSLLAAALVAFRAAKPSGGKAAPELENLAARCAKEGAGPAARRAAALRLWAESEAASRGGDPARLGGPSGWARAAAESLAARAGHAESGYREAVELAMAYGALASYRNAANDELAASALSALRAAFFRDFLEKGRLRSEAGGEGARADIVLCALPFGLIDAGNVVMVETVAALSPARSGRDAALLAWYFAELGRTQASRERGSEASAALEALRSAGGRDALAEAYLCLASDALASSLGDESDPASWHESEGDGSLYRFQDKARLPVFPASGEEVLLRARFAPGSESARAFVVLDCAAGRREIEMRPVGLDGRENYREADIGAFSAFERVSYRFVLEPPGGSRIEGPRYSFSVLSREAVVSASPTGDGGLRLCTRESPEGAAFARVEPTAGGVALRLASSPIPPAAGASPRPTSAAGRGFSRGLSLELGPEASLSFSAQGRVAAEGFSGLGLSALELDLDEEGRIHRALLRLRSSPGERYYGTGERYASVDHGGRSLDSYVFNQYCGQADRSYLPLPFYSSSSGYGLRLSAAGRARLGFDSGPRGYVELELDPAGEGSSLAFTFYEGRAHEALAAYLADSGLPELPPRWAFGPWMSSNNWDSQALCLEQVRLTRELGIPATVLVLEQWSDEATFYIWNDAVYERKPGGEAFALSDFRFPSSGRWPDPKAMVDAMHEAGLRVLLWQAPVMKHMDGIPHAQRDEDERCMVERGYCLERGDGSPYRIPDFEWFRRSLVPDFSNPEARRWWLAKRAYLVDEIGIDGIKTDGGECVYGSSARDFAARVGDELRNAYPVDYEGVFHRWLRERKGGDAMTFSRSGFEGSQAYPAHWAGDERSTFEAFRASVRAGINAGLSGIPFWGWDFAGFSGEVPSAELYLRAASMAALCPIMQYHAESRGEECRDRTPWNIAERSGDPSVLEAYRALARLRMNLLPYLWAEAELSSRTGLPMMRALFAEFPGEPWLGGIDDEYMLGSSILVAPILEEGASSREIVLPKGKWTPLLGGESVEGDRVLRAACPLRSPLCGTAAFIREDSVVSLNLPADFSLPGDVGSSVEDYERLCFLLSVGGGLEAEYRRYDGSSVRLSARREGDLVLAEVENGGDEAIWLADSGAKERRFSSAGPGRTVLRLEASGARAAT